jgi:hypothetical protein
MDERDYKAMNAELKNQTAVEWLVEKLKLQGLLIGEIDNLVAVNQSKEMEKQQIIDSYDEGQRNPYEYSKDSEVNYYDGENYYQETFKK